ATEDTVRALFSPHGTVEKLALINDRDTGRPRGFGFVEMSNADATRAAGALNGTDFGGRALRGSEAQERARASTDAGGPRRRGRGLQLLAAGAGLLWGSAVALRGAGQAL